VDEIEKLLLNIVLHFMAKFCRSYFACFAALCACCLYIGLVIFLSFLSISYMHPFIPLTVCLDLLCTFAVYSTNAVACRYVQREILATCTCIYVPCMIIVLLCYFFDWPTVKALTSGVCWVFKQPENKM